MSDEITLLLQSIDPLREQDLAQVLERGHRDGGAQRIAATRWRRPQRVGVRALSAASIGALLAAGATVAGLSLSSSSTPNAEALSFSQHGNYVIARIINPFASAVELRRELAENHLHVALKLVPASPGSVGKVVMIDVNGTPESGIQPLFEGKCPNGPCTVGVKIARNYRGTGYVVIGRPAKPGERYQTTPIGGSFAPGESLHCSGLSGASLARTLRALERRGLSVVRWRTASGGSIAAQLRALIARLRKISPRGTQQSPAPELGKMVDRRWLVQQIEPVAAGKVEVWATRDSKLSTLAPATRKHQARRVVEAAAALEAAAVGPLHSQSACGGR